MRIKNENNLTNNKINISFSIMIICVIYILISELMFYYKMEYSFIIYSKTYIAIGITNSLSLLILFLGKQKSIFKYKVFYTILLLTLITILSTLLNYNSSYYGKISVLIIDLFMWCATFIIAFESVFNNDNFHKAINLVVFLFPACILLFLIYTFSDQFIIERQPNTIYYILFFLPFVLTIKRKNYKVLCLVAIFICTTISMKRTAFIGLCIAVFLYYLIELNINNRLNKKSGTILITLFILTIFCIYSYNFVINYYNLDIFARFGKSLTDSGFGRTDIWKEVWRQQISSDFNHWVIGKGWNGVVFNANISSGIENLSAHNDFLEVLYDYGVLGLILYLTFIIKLIIYVKKMILEKVEFASAFFASIGLFIVVSLFSHLIIYLNYFYLLMIYWGICIAKYETIKISKKRKNS